MAGHESEKEEMSSRQKAFLAKREELTARLAELDKDMFRVQAQKEKLEEKLEASTAYMWSEYEMTAVQAEAMKKEDFPSLGEVSRIIGGLKPGSRHLARSMSMPLRITGRYPSVSSL